MPKIIVKTGDTKYPLLIERGILLKCGEYVKKTFPKSKAIIISDDNVFALYGQEVLESLQLSGIEAKAIVLPAGEKTKTHDSLLKLYDEFVEMGAQKTDVVIALGGGVIGDLAGFAAASFLRGMGFVQVPTTLLAQVDSSIGGKVAVNLKTGKNLVGAFYHPAFVMIDPNVLSTLSDEDFSAGMAEAIKSGAIADEDLFNLIENHPGRENAEKVIDEIIQGCCKVKSDTVQKDELDAGIRMILNFGHTLGHAIEKTPKNILSHGQAVAVGMVKFALLGEDLGITEKGVSERIAGLVKAFNLPDEYESDRDILIDIMKRDKKIRAGELNIILLEKIGKAVIKQVPIDKIGELI